MTLGNSDADAELVERYLAGDMTAFDELMIRYERQIYRVQAQNSGKPDKVIEKIVDGKIDKFLADICLLEQPFIRDPERTVNEMVTEAVAKLGENIQVRRFVRFQLGEAA